MKWFIVALVLVISVMVASTQEIGECIGEFSVPKLGEYELTDVEFQNISKLSGEDIWIGYPIGYDVPNDTKFMFRIVGIGNEGQEVDITFYGSSSQATIYAFPHKSTQPFSDANGNYYGIHPCGMYEINTWEVLEWLVSIRQK